MDAEEALEKALKDEFVPIEDEDWIILLCPWTTRTSAKGRVPVLVQFGSHYSRSMTYSAEALDGRGQIGEAYLDAGSPVGKHRRQHMKPGASERGIGLGTVLYLAGSLQAAITDEENPILTCTASITADMPRICKTQFGGRRTEDAEMWWQGALEHGFAEEFTARCGALAEITRKIPFNLWEGTLRSELQRAVAEDPEFLNDLLEGYDTEPFGPGERRAPFTVSPIRVLSDGEDGNIAIKIKGTIRTDATRKDVKESLKRWVEDSTSVPDDAWVLGEYPHPRFEFVTTLDVNLDTRQVDIYMTSIQEVSPRVTFTSKTTDTRVDAVRLCGGRLIDEYEMKLWSSESFDNIDIAPSEVYGQMDIARIAPPVLAAMLWNVADALQDDAYVADAVGYMLDFVKETKDKQSRVNLRETISLLEQIGFELELPSRAPNPGRRAVRRNSMRKARKMQLLADIGGDG